jgi:5-methyltetrahydropteroyltriglutamate--homocysteine methyltransferase
VDGWNVWKTDCTKALPLVEQAVSAPGGERILLGSSCSLLHSPADPAEETALPDHIKNRMAFAAQKCAELSAPGGASVRRYGLVRGCGLLEKNAAALNADAAPPESRVNLEFIPIPENLHGIYAPLML